MLICCYYLPSQPAYTSPFIQASSKQSVSKQSSKQAASKQSASSKQQAASKQSASSQPASSQQAVSKQPASSQQAVSKQSASKQSCEPASEMSAEQKNFVIGFRNDSANINAIMEGGYGKNIMDIMVAINSCRDFEEAKKQKIPCIQDYIYKNMQHIDFLVYLYGHSLVIQDYINRFGPIEYSPILDVDFATIIIDNIIIIYEARQFPENTTPKSFVDSSIQYDSQDAVVSDEAPDGYDSQGSYGSQGSYLGGEEEELQSTSHLINPDADITEFLSEL